MFYHYGHRLPTGSQGHRGNQEDAKKYSEDASTAAHTLFLLSCAEGAFTPQHTQQVRLHASSHCRGKV